MCIRKGSPRYYSRGDRRRKKPSFLRSENPVVACIAWTCVILIALLILLGTAMLVSYIFLRPKPPKYHIQDVSVLRLDLTSAAPLEFLSSSILNAGISFVIKIENPNTKIQIYYDNIKMSVFFEDFLIGEILIAPFSQDTKVTSIVQREVEAYNLLFPRELATSLLGSITRQNVALRVVFKVVTRIKVGVLKLPKFKFIEKCVLNVRPLAQFSNGGSLLSKSCSSDIRL